MARVSAVSNVRYLINCAQYSLTTLSVSCIITYYCNVEVRGFRTSEDMRTLGQQECIHGQINWDMYMSVECQDTSVGMQKWA